MKRCMAKGAVETSTGRRYKACHGAVQSREATAVRRTTFRMLGGKGGGVEKTEKG